MACVLTPQTTLMGPGGAFTVFSAKGTVALVSGALVSGALVSGALVSGALGSGSVSG